RTRARTRTLLSLQNQNKKASTASNKPPKICVGPPTTNTPPSYLELRSRKLEKATTPCCTVAPKETHLKNMGDGLYCSDSERSRNVRKKHSHSHSALPVSEEQQPKSKATKLSNISKHRSIHSGSRGAPSAMSYSSSFSQVCSKVKSGRAQRKKQIKKSNDEEDIVPRNSTRAQAGQLQVFLDETPTPIEGSFGGERH
ncbi:hypothetical protein KI387_002441, partial [Taxus chinensis]